jgi:hypothetical protein
MPTADLEIRNIAIARHLPDSHLERWLKIDEPGPTAFLEFAQTLKLRTGQMVAALDLLDEISVRDRCGIADVLSRPALRRTLSANGSTPSRAHTFLEELRAIRFPRLREIAAQIESAIAALRLPRDISILLPRDLASDELTIQLKVSRASTIHQQLETLMSKRSEIAQILAMLGGTGS